MFEKLLETLLEDDGQGYVVDPQTGALDPVDQAMLNAASEEDSSTEDTDSESDTPSADSTKMPETTNSSSAPMSQEDLTSMSISHTQEMFTKLYISSRITELENEIKYLKDKLNHKVDIEFIRTMDNMILFLQITDKLLPTLDTTALFHMIAQLEMDFLDLLHKVDIFNKQNKDQ